MTSMTHHTGVSHADTETLVNAGLAWLHCPTGREWEITLDPVLVELFPDRVHRRVVLDEMAAEADHLSQLGRFDPDFPDWDGLEWAAGYAVDRMSWPDTLAGVQTAAHDELSALAQRLLGGAA